MTDGLHLLLLLLVPRMHLLLLGVDLAAALRRRGGEDKLLLGLDGGNPKSLVLLRLL
jgi:hypothetical protein